MHDVSIASELAAALAAGHIIPYLGPQMLTLCEGETPPATPVALAEVLTARTSVPHKLRKRLTQAAQFIENFKHRKTLVALMNDAFATPARPSPLHRALAASAAPLLVDCWYDGTLTTALHAERPQGDWGSLQGQSQSEHFGQWWSAYAADGSVRAEVPASAWNTMVYQPIGAHAPAANYLVSDTDYVEVLTEIDIQTPIPRVVQALRSGRGFLFLGCRFDDQLARAFARQIMKRSSQRHWAVIEGPLTRMESRFLAEQNIERIDMALAEFAPRFVAALAARAPVLAA